VLIIIFSVFFFSFCWLFRVIS